MSLFGFLSDKGIAIAADTRLKRMSGEKGDWEGLGIDADDHLKDVWVSGDLRVTRTDGGKYQLMLFRCNSNAQELRRDVKKEIRKAFYVYPEKFTVKFNLSDGHAVEAGVRIKPYANARLADWIVKYITEHGKNYSEDDIGRLLTDSHLTSREELEMYFEVDTFKIDDVVVIKPGVTVFGRYRIKSRLGEGGMGEVFLADDLSSTITPQVLLKVLHKDLCQDESARKRFEKEARTLSELRHDHIASFVDFQFNGSTPVLIMKYIEGESLADYLKRQSDEKIAEAEARDLLRPIAKALDYAHGHGIFHLDVKPQNIIVRSTKASDGGRTTCLVDFGISRSADAVGKTTRTTSIKGSVLYMSLEQLTNCAPCATMDVYSLAVTAYECLTGMLPFPDGWKEGVTPLAITPESDFTRSVMRGLGKKEVRPKTCVDLIDPKPDDDHGGGKRGGNGGGGGDGPLPPFVDLSKLTKSLEIYRNMLAVSAQMMRVRGGEDDVTWFADHQAQLAELLGEKKGQRRKDLSHFPCDDARKLVDFFRQVNAKVNSSGRAPDDFFPATDRLVELRSGLPKDFPDDGKFVWQALKDSITGGEIDG